MNIEPQPNWYPAVDKQQAILDFILWFSRFEYAMKNTGAFHMASKGYLEAKWSELKKILKNEAIPISLRETMELLNSNPPNKQIDHNTWRPLQGNSDWPLMIEALKLVRNNLFHGGKHFTGQLLSPERDSLLIDHCQRIMCEMIKIVPEDIQVIFEAA